MRMSVILVAARLRRWEFEISDLMDSIERTAAIASGENVPRMRNLQKANIQ
jgi:hypothetical protein